MLHIIIFTCYLLVLIFSLKVEIDEEAEIKLVCLPFYKMAAMLWKGKLYVVHTFSKTKARRGMNAAVSKSLKSLYPNRNIQKIQQTYEISKVMLFLIILFLGNLLGFLVYLSQQEVRFFNGTVLPRQAEDKGSVKREFLLTIEDIFKRKKIPVTISGREYTAIESEHAIAEAEDKIETIILGSNESLSEVREDLRLIHSIEGNPAEIEWMVSDYMVMDENGKILKNDIAETGETIELCAVITCGKIKKEHYIDVRILPKIRNNEEEWRWKVEKKIEEIDKKTISDHEFHLPLEIDGKKLEWIEKESYDNILIFLFAVMAGIIVICAKDKELLKDMENRKVQMLMDYPEIVNKMILYLGAGMTLHAAWNRITADYEQKRERKKRYAYEEMLLTSYEMKSGISELQAYQRFGKRCGIPQYLKFSALLLQNSKKGTRGLSELLRIEAAEAFEERKNLAKQVGEKAASRLLLPMFLMLVLVMAIIIIPACLSFQF